MHFITTTILALVLGSPTAPEQLPTTASTRPIPYAGLCTLSDRQRGCLQFFYPTTHCSCAVLTF